MILNQQRQVRFAPRALEEFLQRVKKELGVSRSDVTICFVTDAEIARMNQQFRKKKGPTDVLSFPAQDSFSPLATRRSPLPHPAYLGDIAIAPGVARRYAKKHGRTLNSELRVLILHGVLHLLGFDHEADRGEMDRLEQKMRRRFGLA